MGLNPAWLHRPGGAFVIQTVNGERYINGEQSVLNSQSGASLSKNKYLTRVILERNGYQNIPFARAKETHDVVRFISRHKKIIVKPLKGMGCDDIHIVDDVNQIQSLAIKNYILEKYIEGTEMRYLIMNGKVVAVHQSNYGDSVAIDRALERISLEKSDWDQGLCEQAVAISNLFGLGFSAIDYLIDENSDAHILEVNSAPGLKWFHAPSEGPPADVARLLLDSFLV
jgi:glutathione synthase/RimK-type ligase-like ATP-grasp enzyme